MNLTAPNDALVATGCRLIRDEDESQWQALAASATPFHGPAWHRAVQVLGHESWVLATGSPHLTGVLPLSLRRSRLFGRSLVAVPAANQGGPIATDDDSRDRLLQGARHLAEALDVAYLELRAQPSPRPDPEMHIVDDRHVTVQVPLEDGEAKVLSRVRKRVRAYVRAAKRQGLSVGFGHEIDVFHDLYLQTMQRRGSPPFGRSFFAAILDAFGDRAEIGLVRLGDRPAAADLLVRDEHTLYSLFAGSCADLHAHRPNDLLVHETLRRACDLGLKRFDLGRSPTGSSVLNFKRGWGGTVVPLSYSYLLRTRLHPPSRDPEAFPWRTLGRAWSHLPAPLVRHLGPRIVRNLH